MAENSRSTQLAIVGGGPGGYAAAFHAADLGLRVTLIDPETNPGGVCLYCGCIPSKALLHVCRLINEASDAKDWGVAFTEPKVSLTRLRSWKNGVVKKLTGGLGQLSKQRKIDYVKGSASFADGTSLRIKKSGGDVETLKFEHAVLATGSVASTVPGFPPFSARVMHSTTALELGNIPKSLLVVGGGYIGLELGTVYATLGSKVTLVEMMPNLLPGVDTDLVMPLKKRLTSLFDDVLLSTTVKEITERKSGVRVTLSGPDTNDRPRTFEKVLVAVGRRPNSRSVGLENTRVELDDRGFVRVDAQRRTAESRVFAIGDVTGEPMLAHKASHEGRVAVEAVVGRDVVFGPQAIPAVVFTDPEIAWCGLTEIAAKETGREVQVSKFPWGASGRAATLGRGDGLTKLIVDPKTERVLGVGITGPGAGEMIAEGVLGIEMAALASDIGLTIHPHPTLSETIMEAADLYYGQSTHFYRPKRR